MYIYRLYKLTPLLCCYCVIVTLCMCSICGFAHVVSKLMWVSTLQCCCKYETRRPHEIQYQSQQWIKIETICSEERRQRKKESVTPTNKWRNCSTASCHPLVFTPVKQHGAVTVQYMYVAFIQRSSTQIQLSVLHLLNNKVLCLSLPTAASPMRHLSNTVIFVLF